MEIPPFAGTEITFHFSSLLPILTDNLVLPLHIFRIIFFVYKHEAPYTKAQDLCRSAKLFLRSCQLRT